MSRAKEKIVFVLSKPIRDFKGNAQKILNHYWNEIENASPEDGFVPARRVSISNDKTGIPDLCEYLLSLNCIVLFVYMALIIQDNMNSSHFVL